MINNFIRSGNSLFFVFTVLVVMNLLFALNIITVICGGMLFFAWAKKRSAGKWPQRKLIMGIVIAAVNLLVLQAI